MPGWARISELDRSLRCVGSTVLPQVPYELRQSDSSREAAEWGTMVHRWKATGFIVPHEDHPNHKKLFLKKLAAIGVVGVEQETAFRNQWWPESGIHEVSVAFDCLGYGVAWSQTEDPDTWKASFGSSWITGTLDYVGDVLGVPWVDDLKTGSWPPTPPAKSAQLRGYSLARMRLVLGPPPESCFLSITHWPRYPLAGLPQRYMLEVSAEHLKAVDSAVRRKYLQHVEADNLVVGSSRAGEVLREAGHLKVGDYCKFCPSQHFCPLAKSSKKE